MFDLREKLPCQSILVASQSWEIAAELERALRAAGMDDITVDHAPSHALAARVVAANRASFIAVLVDLSDEADPMAAIANLRKADPKPPVFAFAHSPAARARAAEATEAGASAVLEQIEELPGLLERSRAQQGLGAKQAQLVLFAPAQEGAGASTTALHTASLLATRHGARTLLTELDYHSDSVAYRLRLKDAKSLSELGRTDTWRSAVTEWNELHLLPAPSSPRMLRTRGLPEIAQALVESCQEYEFVIGDLPCNTSVVSPELLASSDRIYLVATAEVTSLYLARRRVLNLVTAGAPSEAIRLVINRDRPGAVDSDLALQVTGFTPANRLPNDFEAASQAETEAGVVAPSSDLGKAYATLARDLAAARPRPEQPDQLKRWSRLLTWR